MITSLGFKCLACEWCIYCRQTPTGVTLFAIHVDDIIMVSSSAAENSLFKSELHWHWEISNLEEVKYALGIAIACNCSTCTITLSQTSLIDQIVEQFGQLNAHPVTTPMVPGVQITCPDKTLPISEHVNLWILWTPYWSLVGTLNYLMVASHSDIAFAVRHLVSVLDCYWPKHWEAAICVICYLKDTRLFNLTLGRSNTIHPISFSDSDWMNCPTTSRSVGATVFHSDLV